MSNLTYSETSRKHEAEDRLIFDVCDRKKKSLHFQSGRYKRDKRIKLPERKLVRLPRSVQDVNVEESELGNTGIDGAVRETARILNPEDKIAHVLPGSIFRTWG